MKTKNFLKLFATIILLFGSIEIISCDPGSDCAADPTQTGGDCTLACQNQCQGGSLTQDMSDYGQCLCTCGSQAPSNKLSLTTSLPTKLTTTTTIANLKTLITTKK